MVSSGIFNMTMNIPSATQNPSKQHCYGSSSSNSFGVMNRLEGYYNNHNNYGCSETCLLLGSSLSSDHHLLPVTPPPLPPPLMADHQDESRTESINEAGSSSNYYQDDQEAEHHHVGMGWLQLGIGNQFQSQPQQNNNHNNNNNKVEEELGDQESSRRRSGGLVELDLLPTSGNITNNRSSEELRSFMMFRDCPRPISSIFVPGGAAAASSRSTNIINSSSSSSSSYNHQEIINSSWGGFISPFPRNYNYFPRPNFQLIHTGGLVASRPPPPPPLPLPLPFPPPLHANNSIDFRVIDPPPPRPHSGIWFMLQAAQIQ